MLGCIPGPISDHAAFKQLIGDRTGNFVQEVLAHWGIFPEYIDSFRLHPARRLFWLLFLRLQLLVSRRLVFLHDFGGNLVNQRILSGGLASIKRAPASSVQTKKLVSFLVFFSYLLFFLTPRYLAC